MKTLTWVDITRKSIKSKLGFGWSVQGIEKQNKVKTKVVYRFSTGQRTTVLTDLDWLLPEDKHDNRVKISTAGRNSTPLDLVIEQIDRAVWVDHGSSANIAESYDKLVVILEKF